jgi:hypothetical protein
VSRRLHTLSVAWHKGTLTRLNNHYLVTFKVTFVIWVLPPPVALMVMV